MDITYNLTERSIGHLSKSIFKVRDSVREAFKEEYIKQLKKVLNSEHNSLSNKWWTKTRQTNIEVILVQDGDEFLNNARKYIVQHISYARYPRCVIGGVTFDTASPFDTTYYITIDKFLIDMAFTLNKQPSSVTFTDYDRRLFGEFFYYIALEFAVAKNLDYLS